MVELSGPNGASLEVTIEGYEFPALATVEYDSNWLNVRISVKGPLGSWKAVAPALLTYEVADLAQWLADLGDGYPTHTDWHGMEPNLAFSWVPTEQTALKAHFAAEFRPRGTARSDDIENPGRRYILDLAVSRTDLFNASQALRAQLKRYPQRTKV